MSELTIDRYNERSFAVRGNSKPIYDEMKKHCAWSPRLVGGEGWICSNTKEPIVKEIVDKYNRSLTSSTRTSPVTSPTRTSQVVSPTRTSQVTSPTRTSQATSPTRTSQVTSPTRTSQVTSPTRTSQVTSPTRTTQITRPLSPRRISNKMTAKAFNDLSDFEIMNLLRDQVENDTIQRRKYRALLKLRDQGKLETNLEILVDNRLFKEFYTLSDHELIEELIINKTPYIAGINHFSAAVIEAYLGDDKLPETVLEVVKQFVPSFDISMLN